MDLNRSLSDPFAGEVVEEQLREYVPYNHEYLDKLKESESLSNDEVKAIEQLMEPQYGEETRGKSIAETLARRKSEPLKLNSITLEFCMTISKEDISFNFIKLDFGNGVTAHGIETDFKVEDLHNNANSSPAVLYASKIGKAVASVLREKAETFKKEM